MDFREEFDGIWACASLLHVPKAELNDVLQRLKHAAKRGGILFVSLKEGDGERLSEDGRYFSYFRIGNFKTLLKSADWEIIEAGRKVADAGREWLNFLARKQ